MAGLAAVIPLPHKQTKPTTCTAASPEPVQLYALILIALFLHGPMTEQRCGGGCRQCSKPYPCPQVRLACRLLDGL
jgi:hypothetical protein